MLDKKYRPTLRAYIFPSKCWVKFKFNELSMSYLLNYTDFYAEVWNDPAAQTFLAIVGFRTEYLL